MRLQEKAFMIDLINRRYYQRISFRIFEAILALVGFVIILIATCLLPDTVIGLPMTALGIISFFVGVLAIIFLHKPIGLEESSPKRIKEKQIEALEQNKHTSFEDLIYSIPLKEYFEN
jgi:hypothetical protein